MRNVTPRAKGNDEGHLQESLNFPSRGIEESDLSQSAPLHPSETPDFSLSLYAHALIIY